MMVARRRSVKGNVNGALADRKCSENVSIAEQPAKVKKKAAVSMVDKDKTVEKTTRPRGKSIAETKLKDKNGVENKSKNNNDEKRQSTTGPTTTTTTSLAGKKRERQAGNSVEKRRRSNPTSKKVAEVERHETQSKAKVAAKVVQQPTLMRKPTDAPQVLGPTAPVRPISQNKRNRSVASQIIDLNSSSEDEQSPRKGAGGVTGGVTTGARAGAGANRVNQAQVAPMKFGASMPTTTPTTAATTTATTTTAATTTKNPFVRSQSTATTTTTNPFMPPQSTAATTSNPFMPPQPDRESSLQRYRDEFKRLQDAHVRETNELNKKQGLQQEELNRHHHQQRYRKNSVVGRREQTTIREQHANEHRRLKENQDEEMRRMRIKLMQSKDGGCAMVSRSMVSDTHGKQTGAPHAAHENEPQLGAPKRKRVEPEQHDQKRRQVAQAAPVATMDFMTPLSHLPVKTARERIYDLPIYFPEYREENFRICKENQMEFAPTFDYINSLEEITNNNRTLVVDWLIEIHYKYKFSPESIFLAISVLDRFLALRPKTQRKKLQLYAGTCLLLAAKFQEQIPISMSIRDACYIMDYLYDETAVRYAECEIMEFLDFKLVVPSPYIFLQNNVVECGLALNDRIYYLALFFLDVTLLDAYFLRYTPQERALGALYLAMTAGGKCPWPQSLTRLNGYDEAQVKLFAAKIKRAYPEYKEKTVYKKYRRAETQEVVKYFNL